MSAIKLGAKAQLGVGYRGTEYLNCLELQLQRQLQHPHQRRESVKMSAARRNQQFTRT